MTSIKRGKSGLSMLTGRVDRRVGEGSRMVTTPDRLAMWAVVRELMRAWRERRQVFLLGNGSGAALACRMAENLNEMMVPSRLRFHAAALTDPMPRITWKGDTALTNAFVRHLTGHCRPSDVVVTLSCHDDSPEILPALQIARQAGVRTVGLVGDDGASLQDALTCVSARPQV
jgi:D-sedoheptulose 7-phosphate isomerase